MRRLNRFFLYFSILLVLAGCGVSKGQFQAALRQKEDLEAKLMQMTEDHQKLQKEHEVLLAEEEGLRSDLEKTSGEKEALRVEYDRILNDKISLKSDYDRLLRERQVLDSQVYELQQRQRSETR